MLRIRPHTLKRCASVRTVGIGPDNEGGRERASRRDFDGRTNKIGGKLTAASFLEELTPGGNRGASDGRRWNKSIKNPISEGQ